MTVSPLPRFPFSVQLAIAGSTCGRSPAAPPWSSASRAASPVGVVERRQGGKSREEHSQRLSMHTATWLARAVCLQFQHCRILAAQSIKPDDSVCDPLPCYFIPTGISQVNDTQLLTTAGDGRLMVWDLRNASAGPVKFAVPDARWGQPQLCLCVFACSPERMRTGVGMVAAVLAGWQLGPHYRRRFSPTPILLCTRRSRCTGPSCDQPSALSQTAQRWPPRAACTRWICWTQPALCMPLRRARRARPSPRCCGTRRRQKWWWRAARAAQAPSACTRPASASEAWRTAIPLLDGTLAAVIACLAAVTRRVPECCVSARGFAEGMPPDIVGAPALIPVSSCCYRGGVPCAHAYTCGADQSCSDLGSWQNPTRICPCATCKSRPRSSLTVCSITHRGLLLNTAHRSFNRSISLEASANGPRARPSPAPLSRPQPQSLKGE